MVNTNEPVEEERNGLETSAPPAPTKQRKLSRKYKVVDVLSPKSTKSEEDDAIAILLKLISQSAM